MADGGGTGVPADGDGGWDFFVSYTQVDRDWAEWIAWTLEEAGHRVLVQAWDFVPGTNWVHGMQEGVTCAARTVAVLSAAYAGSVFGSAEWQAAWAADPTGAQRKLLVVRVEDCARPGVLGQVVSLDLFGISPERAREDLVRSAGLAVSGGRAKPDSAPPFPSGRRAGSGRGSSADAGSGAADIGAASHTSSRSGSAGDAGGQGERSVRGPIVGSTVITGDGNTVDRPGR